MYDSLVIDIKVREKMLENTCAKTRNAIQSGEDLFWIVLEDSQGFDLKDYSFYEMIDCLNKGELYERTYFVFDNYYDARWKLDQLIAEAEANI